MEAKELRIGNYITSKSSSLDYWEVTASDIEHISDNPSHYTPIPLTEEWLVKFGVEIKPLSKGVIYDRFILSWKEAYNYWYVMDKESLTYMTKIEFVHEWQNFIHVMNNKELTINE